MISLETETSLHRRVYVWCLTSHRQLYTKARGNCWHQYWERIKCDFSSGIFEKEMYVLFAEEHVPVLSGLLW